MAEIHPVLSVSTDVITATGSLPCHTDSDGEDTSLLPKPRRSWLSLRIFRYHNTGKCIHSKAAVVILFWSFVVGLMSGFSLNPDLLWELLEVYHPNKFYYFLGAYGGVALLYCIYPIAGCLADVKFGRYKTVFTSAGVVLMSTVSLATVGVASVFHVDDGKEFPKGLYIAAALLVLPLDVGLIGFMANVVQFGMDQLHESPGDDRTIFIHWYVWLYNFSVAIGQSLFITAVVYNGSWVQDNTRDNKKYFHISVFAILGLVILIVLVLVVILCFVRYKRNWFLIESGRTNPYRLVYGVTKFACQHKTPVRRSAFTYCEDELPTGLDLGKEKYGGCFTTEEVEDVKAFYGILKVLFSFGIVFFLDFAANSILPLYAITHTSHSKAKTVEIFFIEFGLLSPLLVIVCIPLYLFLLRPFVICYVPGMLRRMGLGMLLAVLSLISSFAMDARVHMEEKDAFCMFDNTVNDTANDAIPEHSQNNTLYLLQLTMGSLSHMLTYIAVYEFICSQSPHNMKGLLIGLLSAVKGFYQVIATILVIPFAHISHFPSCGFYYYLVNIIIGLLALLVYMWVAKRYRYRERDEPSRVRQFVEEYFSSN